MWWCTSAPNYESWITQQVRELNKKLKFKNIQKFKLDRENLKEVYVVNDETSISCLKLFALLSMYFPSLSKIPFL